MKLNIFSHRIEGVDGHSLLTIENACKTSHDAWYTATAINKGGRDLTRCKVNVVKSGDAPQPEKKLFIPKTKKSFPQSKVYEQAEIRKVDLFYYFFSFVFLLFVCDF